MVFYNTYIDILRAHKICLRQSNGVINKIFYSLAKSSKAVPTPRHLKLHNYCIQNF